MAKTKAEKICEWFFKVVEAQRAMNELEKEGENKFDIDLCLGNNKQIQILNSRQFDMVVKALTSVYDEAFVGKVTDDEREAFNEKYIWRSFKYSEFNVGTCIRIEKGE